MDRIKDTLHINGEDFYEHVVDKTGKKMKEGLPWFIKYYAPWCGHCKALNSTWHELADKLQGIANVVKIDCT